MKIKHDLDSAAHLAHSAKPPNGRFLGYFAILLARISGISVNNPPPKTLRSSLVVFPFALTSCEGIDPGHNGHTVRPTDTQRERRPSETLPQCTAPQRPQHGRPEARIGPSDEPCARLISSSCRRGCGLRPTSARPTPGRRRDREQLPKGPTSPRSRHFTYGPSSFSPGPLKFHPGSRCNM